MNILVLGNMGYVGSVLMPYLHGEHPQWKLHGVDAGFFRDQLVPGYSRPETALTCQTMADVRDASPSWFHGVDGVVYLAAVSNDPMGALYEKATYEINHMAAIRCALLARDAGVSHYVFASSCSVYGAAGAELRREGDPLHPVSAYACSKVAAEIDLNQVARTNFRVTSLRFGTACGASPRLRLDLVLNTMVHRAYWHGQLDIFNEGKSWRPLIDVHDMARAMDWALQRVGPASVVVNVGANAHNYRVQSIADAVVRQFPQVLLEVSPNGADHRSYCVDFSQYRMLAPTHQPQMNPLLHSLEAVAHDVAELPPQFPLRLEALTTLVRAGVLDAELRHR